MIVPDKPIENPEEDLFGFIDAAKKNARVLLRYIEQAKANNDSSGIVIGIEGNWGSGKTSYVNLIIKYVTEDKYRTIAGLDKYSKPACYTMAKMSYVTMENMWQEYSTILKNYYSIYGILDKYLQKLNLTNPNKNFARIKNLLSSIKLNIGGLGNFDFKQLVSGVSLSIDEQKEEICNVIKKSCKWLIIVIDEIDRMSPDEVLQVLQFVKYVADFPQIIYILPYDTRAIKKILDHRDLEYEYIEKIMNMQISIPAKKQSDLSNKILASIKNNIKHDREVTSEQFFMYIDEYIAPIVKTPRNCNSLSNSFYLNYLYIGDDCYLNDLLAITAIKLFCRNVYSFILENKDELCTDEKLKNFIYKDSNLNELYYKDFSEEEKKLLKDMFPRFEQKLEKRDNPRERSSLGIDKKGNFDKYFTYSISEGEISWTEFKHLFDINEINHYRYKFKQWYEENKKNYKKSVEEFANKFDNSLEKIAIKPKLKNFLIAMSVFIDETAKDNRAKRQGLLNFYSSMITSIVVEGLRKDNSLVDDELLRYLLEDNQILLSLYSMALPKIKPLDDYGANKDMANIYTERSNFQEYAKWIYEAIAIRIEENTPFLCQDIVTNGMYLIGILFIYGEGYFNQLMCKCIVENKIAVIAAVFISLGYCRSFINSTINKKKIDNKAKQFCKYVKHLNDNNNFEKSLKDEFWRFYTE